ncbi:MAG: hypothetical protein ABIQ17_00865, partial [Candidatus Limnocylindrales bacterium]
PHLHSDHDRMLVTALASGDLTDRDVLRAQGLVDTCAECRALADDLRVIETEIQRLPAPVRPESQMFTIEADVADRLRRGAFWRQLLHPFAGSGGALRPAAGALMTLGLAGLLFAAAPLLPFGSASSSRDATTAEAQATVASEGLRTAPDAPAPGATQPTTPQADGAVDAGPAYGGIAPAPGDSTVGGDAGGSKQAAVATPGPETAAPPTPDPTKWPPLPWLSAGLLALGFGLLVLRRMAIRAR